MLKLALPITIIVVFICVAGLLLMPKWHIKNSEPEVSAQDLMLLAQLGDSALQTADIPVAAILTYDGNIIGKGFNTVIKTGRVGEHAEINAISNAIQRIGRDSFQHLDIAKLKLVTTWEPCMMCRGAINQADIYQVTVIKTKPMKNWLHEVKKDMMYHWHKQVTNTDSLQMQLFRKHPQYEKNKANL